MRHFSAIRTPSGRPCRLLRGATALALGATLASTLAIVGAGPALAGTSVRGRVHLPVHKASTLSDGRTIRETLDPRDVVLYVTGARPEDIRRLGGRARRVDIDLVGDRFTPRVEPIVVGSKVRFRNRDRVYHTVFSVSPAGRFDLGNLAPGDQREIKLESPGVINLFCQLHPAAAGFVIVCPNWYYARAGTSGEFQLPDLPRGQYVVHAWHPRLGATRRRIVADGSHDVTLALKL